MLKYQKNIALSYVLLKAQVMLGITSKTATALDPIDFMTVPNDARENLFEVLFSRVIHRKGCATPSPLPPSPTVANPTTPTTPTNPTSDNCQGITSVPGWIDSEGNTCDWYATGDSEFKCGTFGNRNENDGFVANTACCICQVSCPIKRIRIEDFCIEGDPDTGDNAEIQVQVNGQRYFPMNDGQCTPDPSGFCLWSNYACHALDGADWKIIENSETLTMGTEEHDFFGNDKQTAALLSSDWHNPSCAPYEVKFSMGFQDSFLNQVCWTDSGIVASSIGQSCDSWMNPADSYIFRMSVHSQYDEPTSAPTPAPSLLPSLLSSMTPTFAPTPEPNIELCSGSVEGWKDTQGNNCNWYADGDSEFKCATYGSTYRNLGYVANEACCTCKSACATKEVQIHRFCIFGDDADSGPNVEMKLRLNGATYFPQNDSQCATDPSGYCSWREGQCHNLNGASWKEVTNFGSLTVGTEEHDTFSENDSYSTLMSSNDWHTSQCAPYEVRFSVQFEAETVNTRCWSFDATLSGTYYGVTGELNGGVQECSTWTNPAQTYVWLMYVFPKYDPLPP